MVVLMVACLDKSGKLIMRSNFVDMPPERSDALLAVFPKLVESGNQPTHSETKDVRYVYQPIEATYLLLLTSKRSNIEEDIDSLRLISEQIREKAHSLDGKGIGFAAFQLCFAFDNIIYFRHKRYITYDRLCSYAMVHMINLRNKKIIECKAIENDQSQKADGEIIMEDACLTAGSSETSLPPPTDPITLTAEEKLNVTLNREGGVDKFDVQGTLSLQILNQDDGPIQVQIENGGNPSVHFMAHPDVNKDLFFNKDLFTNDIFLGLKDRTRPFPAGDGVGLLEWRMQSVNESVVPLSINCWPSVSCDDFYDNIHRKEWALFDVHSETYVSIEYEASTMFDLQNVVISVPLPALKNPPSVRHIDGEWRYDSKNSILEWSIIRIDNSNRSGSMEFVVPLVDTTIFFPISVRFTAASTFSELKVANVLPVGGGPNRKFTQRSFLSAENYQLVY